MALKLPFTCRRLLQSFSVPAQILWMLLGIVLLLRVVWGAVTQSMFFDGLIYASLARNISEGIGTIWRPSFSDGLFPLFSEHPPLMFGMEALGFLVFGDSIWVEKTFTITVTLLCCLCFIGIWRRINEDDRELRPLGAFPLILALISGRVGWAFSNNMLEILVILFTLFAVYLIVTTYGRVETSFRSRLPALVLAGLAIALAFFTKGPVGLFPLATIGICAMAFGRPSLKTAVVDTAVLLAVFLAIVGFLTLFAEPRGSMFRYIDGQVLSSLSGERGSRGGGLKGLWSMVRVNFWLIAISALLWGVAHAVARNAPSDNGFSIIPLPDNRRRKMIFFFLVGLSASAPLLVSPRIHNFYFNPSLFYFSAAISVASVSAFLYLIARAPDLTLKRLKMGLGLAMTASVVVVGASAGRPGPDRDLIADARTVASVICPDQQQGSCERGVLACGAAWQNTQLHAYLQRLHKISLIPADIIPDTVAKYDQMIGDESCTSEQLAPFAPSEATLSSYQLLVRH